MQMTLDTLLLTGNDSKLRTKCPKVRQITQEGRTKEPSHPSWNHRGLTAMTPYQFSAASVWNRDTLAASWATLKLSRKNAPKTHFGTIPTTTSYQEYGFPTILSA